MSKCHRNKNTDPIPISDQRMISAIYLQNMYKRHAEAIQRITVGLSTSETKEKQSVESRERDVKRIPNAGGQRSDVQILKWWFRIWTKTEQPGGVRRSIRYPIIRQDSLKIQNPRSTLLA